MSSKFKYLLSSSRIKITLWYSLIFLVLEILLGGLLYISLYRSLESNLEKSLKFEAEIIDKVLVQNKINFETFTPDSVYTDSEDLLWDIIYSELLNRPRNNFIQVKYKDKIIFKSVNLGNEFFSIKYPVAGSKIVKYKNLNLSSKDLIAAVLYKNDYQIIVASNRDYISQSLSSLLNIYVYLAPLFFIISIAGGIFLSEKSLSRIDSIIKETEEITAHNLSKKIEGEQFNDEYGRLVKKMNEMTSRIKTSMDYMNQFSVSAAHELKTPLTILRGETEIALKSSKTPQQYIEVLSSNYEEILRLIKIVDNLFFISKMENSLVVIDKVATDLDEYLNSLGKSLKILGADKNINIIVQSNTNAKIDIDKELLKQAISNLVDNAVKYGRENADIILKGDSDNLSVSISVINKGEEIPSESLSKIFDNFYRVESSRNRKLGGAGLGLAVVNAIVKWHSAKIVVKSELEKGTEFKIIFQKHPA